MLVHCQHCQHCQHKATCPEGSSVIKLRRFLHDWCKAIKESGPADDRQIQNIWGVVQFGVKFWLAMFYMEQIFSENDIHYFCMITDTIKHQMLLTPLPLCIVIQPFLSLIPDSIFINSTFSAFPIPNTIPWMSSQTEPVQTQPTPSWNHMTPLSSTRMPIIRKLTAIKPQQSPIHTLFFVLTQMAISQ